VQKLCEFVGLSEEEMVSRLIIVERPEGKTFRVVAKAASIVSLNESNKVSILVESEDLSPDETKALTSFFEASMVKQFVSHNGMERVIIEGVVVSNSEDPVMSSVLVVRNICLTKTEKSAWMSPVRLGEICGDFGLLMEPSFPMPAVMMDAIIDKDKGKVTRLGKRMKGFPSIFGGEKEKINLVVIPGLYTCDEDKERCWAL
jgi:hypothetical protein